MDTLHFNIFLQQNVTQFSQNPAIHQKRQNDVLPDNVNMDVSLKLEVLSENSYSSFLKI